MNISELQQYMYQRIPLSRAMSVDIVAADAQSVTLRAPLAPNINHRNTVFGGSASAVALLAGWALLFLRLRHDGMDGYIVVRTSTMNYEKPIADEFTATTAIDDPARWQEFTEGFRRKGRARLSLVVVLHSGGEKVGELSAEFVVAATRD